MRDAERKQAFALIGLALFFLPILYLLYFFETYLSLEHRLLIGWVLLALLMLLFRRNFIKERMGFRVFFLFLGGFVSMRYIMWRTFDTLAYTGAIDFVCMMLLYLAEVYAVAIHFMGMFINSFPLRHEPVPLPEDTSLWPTVDVLIPCYTEPEDLVKVTAIAAKQMDYPPEKLHVIICDDGSTVQRRENIKTSEGAWERYYRMRKIAEEIGVTYVTREKNVHAKAGNMNAALRFAHGDIILILDCDHVPTRDMLTNTVGWFLKDEKLWLVQTPHFFINPTPIEKNLGNDASKVPVENDMFFRIMHLGFDAWNASYFCGSAALLRRKCIDLVGGIVGITITEDAETSLEMHGKGFTSVYIDRPMVCGLSPETFNDYIVQRTRWAQGMVQLFILQNPLTKRGLSLPQRICYFNSCFFWFFGIPRIIYFISPALFLIVGLKVYHATIAQMIAYGLPHLFSTFFLMDFLYGKTRKPLFSELYETVQSLFLVPAVISAILAPLKPTFKITPKGMSNVQESLNPLASSFLLVLGINGVAIVLAVYKYIYFPVYRDVITVTFSWCMYNSIMVLLALGAFWERKQVRYYHRINTKGRAEIYFHRFGEKQLGDEAEKAGITLGEFGYKGDVQDISLSGIGLIAKLPFQPKQNENVRISVWDSYGERYEFEATIPRAFGRGPGRYLIGSNLPLNDATYAKTIKYVYGDSQRWVDYWDQTSESGGTGKLLWLFFVQGLKAVVESVGSISKVWGLAMWEWLNAQREWYKGRQTKGEEGA